MNLKLSLSTLSHRTNVTRTAYLPKDAAAISINATLLHTPYTAYINKRGREGKDDYIYLENTVHDLEKVFL